MKLDVTALRYLGKDELRVLTAVEMGMKNHEMVPVSLLCSISGLRYGGAEKALRELHKHKLLHHEQRGYNGYRLTSLGYDYLALSALSKRGTVARVGSRLGVGKEADVFHAQTDEGELIVMKVHRLGRTSFRAVKDKRDYHRHRRSASWLYLSRLAATREYAFLSALSDHGFPVPKAIDCSRHIVVMGLVDGYPLTQVRELGNPAKVCNRLLDVAVQLAEVGLVHCDLNEFNVLVDDDEKVTVIDFPQMISTSHSEAPAMFQRDVESLYKFFRHRYGLDEEIHIVDYASVEKKEGLDVALEASGYGAQDLQEFEQAMEDCRRLGGDHNGGDADSDNNAGSGDSDPEHETSADRGVATGKRGPHAGSSADTAEPETPDAIEESGPSKSLEPAAPAGGDSTPLDTLEKISPAADRETEREAGADEVHGTAAADDGQDDTYDVQQRLGKAQIAERVRKQREKRSRKQAARKNAVKSDSKRKIRNELSTGSFWSAD